MSIRAFKILTAPTAIALDRQVNEYLAKDSTETELKELGRYWQPHGPTIVEREHATHSKTITPKELAEWDYDLVYIQAMVLVQR